MIKKFCLTCGNEFKVIPYRKSAKFCSRECHYAFGRTNKECLFCGKPFVTTNWMNKEYCSRKCAIDVKKRRIVKKCIICDKQYEVQKHLAETLKYCSINCRNKGISKTLTGKFKGRKNPNYKEKITKICKYCGKKFEIYPYRKNIANHCTIRCSKLDTSDETRKKIAESVKRLQKENPKIHPNYILAQKGHITQIERLVKGELIKRKLQFETQYRILNYWIDFAFPDIKLAVECDGGRWHSTKEQILRDKKREEILINDGWKVLRFKEKDIIKDTKRVVNKIEKFISNARGKEVFRSP